MQDDERLYLCWTTTSRREEAEALVRAAIEQGLAACGQIEGPIDSVYKWQGQVQCEQEFRILFKALATQLEGLEALIEAKHPYDTPEWVCLPAEKVSEKYLKWATEVSNLRGFP